MINITDTCVNILKNFNFQNKNYKIPQNILHSFDRTYKKEYEYEKIEICNLKQKKIFEQLIKNNKFISEKIKEKITLDKIYYETIKYENILINFIFPDNKNTNINYNIFIHICLFYRSLTENNKDILIYIYFGDSKKTYPNDNYFTEHHVNSGLSYSSDDVKYIFIWRKEEVIKVLFHELIHYFQIDYSDEIYKIEYIIKKNFNIKGKDAPCESFTEILATIFNCVFCSLYFKIDVGILINYEIQFSNFQITKILNNMSSDYNEILQTSLNKKYIYQKTNVVSYFFIKNIVMNNIDVFLQLIENNLYINNIINEYCKLIYYKIKNNSKYLKSPGHNKLCGSNNSIIKNTFRMSCVEFDIFNK